MFRKKFSCAVVDWTRIDIIDWSRIDYVLFRGVVVLTELSKMDLLINIS